LQFVDALSLQWQYYEIFVITGYDFSTTNQSPLIVDCGANVGLSVARFKLQYPRSRILAFEADSDIARMLTANVRSMRLSDVTVRNDAVWVEAKAVPFTADHVDGGYIEASSSIRVQSVRLADLITEPVDLLKLDIEGAEFEVLRDLCESGKIAFVRKISCEFHGRANATQDLGETLSRLTQAGLRFTLTDARTAPNLPGPEEHVPFTAVADAKYLLRLYAWRNDAASCERIVSESAQSSAVSYPLNDG
jgi:FkbM family methyltransferase